MDIVTKMLATASGPREAAAIQMAAMVIEQAIDDRDSPVKEFDPATLAILAHLLATFLPIIIENCTEKSADAMNRRADQQRIADMVYLRWQTRRHLITKHGRQKGMAIYADLGGGQIASNMLDAAADPECIPLLQAYY